MTISSGCFLNSPDGDTMSRSYRHTQIFSHCSNGAQKRFKKYEHQAERTNVKIALKLCKDYDNMVLPSPKDYGNEWISPRDGKFYWKNAGEKDMRK